MRKTNRFDIASLTSLVLSALLADDGLTAQELGQALGLPTIEIRPALRALLAAGAVVTSGRTRGTRYSLAVEEQAQVVVTAAPSARRTPRARRASPVIEVVDLTEQLAQTLALATPSAPLHAVRTEFAPVVQLLAGEAALLAAIATADPFQFAA